MDLFLLSFKAGIWEDIDFESSPMPELKDAPGTESFAIYPNSSHQLVNIDFCGVSQNCDLSVYSVSDIDVYRNKAVKRENVFSLRVETYIVKANNGRTTQFKMRILTD